MKRHPYLLATIIATLLATIVWLCVPKEYTATTKLSDEYKEVDLAIGLTPFSASIKDALGGSNTGLNEFNTYSKVLKSDDFARQISLITVPGTAMTYGQYLGKEDTVQAVKKRIAYNISNKQATLTISFTDKDPLIASQMLDSVTHCLQEVITSYRRFIDKAALDNAERSMNEAAEKYHHAQEAYATYSDSHQHAVSSTTKQEEASLYKDVQQCYVLYKDAIQQFIRHQSLLQRSYMSFAIVKANTMPQTNNDYFIGYLLVFILVALAGTKGYFLYKKRQRIETSIDFGELSSPWSITITVWGFLLIALQFCDPTLLQQPTEQFYISLSIWFLLFCSTSFAAYTLTDTGSKPIMTGEQRSNEFTSFNKFVFYFLLSISIVITPIYVKKIMDIVLMFGTEDLMANVRTLSVYGDTQMGILNYSSVVNEALLLVALWSYPRIKLWQVIWACSACLLNSIAIMEKGGILLVFFCIMFLLFEKKKIKIRTILVLSVVMVFLFYVFNLLRAEEDSDYQKNETLLGFIAMYVMSPPVAYCELTEDVTQQFGGHTFSLIYVFLNRFGFGPYVISERLQEFVFVPIPTNVYTIFQPFFLDFGQKGVACFACFYGIVSGLAYRLMRNGTDFGKCVYMYTAYILLLQFYQENVFTVNLHVIQLIFFVYLCTQKRFNFSLLTKHEQAIRNTAAQ